VIGLVMRFLSPDTRALVQLAMRMVSALDTPEERRAVAEYGMKMLADGSVTITEWAAFGKRLGVFRIGGRNGS
jgi:hypothetical protein